ncbi:MAG: DUF6169 family protein, partial [Spirosomaceae bacterium]|nr:DUF6169 family protein [Spirosomataceae bacterium]
MLEFPYPITENPDGTYHFTSDLGIKYTIALFDASFHFNHFVVPNGSIVEFSFGADSTPQFDPRITTTILAFLSNFFQNSQNVLLYVCDSLDRKQLTRKRIFEKWFSRFRTPYLEQYDFSFLLED